MFARDIAMSLTSLPEWPYFFRDTFRLRDELPALGFAFALGGGGSGVLRRRERPDRSLW
jgi:hypothetical protein